MKSNLRSYIGEEWLNSLAHFNIKAESIKISDFNDDIEVFALKKSRKKIQPTLGNSKFKEEKKILLTKNVELSKSFKKYVLIFK